jgi:demethylmenaquinone methyltransferase / 2-methoxy-6-polyprenyl-1,4-benzoquinol methylase
MGSLRKVPPGPGHEKANSWRMFDRIARRYDLLNRLLSFRQDVRWRRRLVAHLPARNDLCLLDLATGTGDVLVEALRRPGRVGHAVGMDMAGAMLSVGQGKGLGKTADLVRADATRIPAASNSFDAVTIAFGIRNVDDVGKALREMRRVLKPGGRALVLEFSLPRWRILRAPYLFYFRHVLPRLGAAISGDGQAYRYLNETAEAFPYGQAFRDLMTEAGFANVTEAPLTFGIATIYQGERVDI